MLTPVSLAKIPASTAAPHPPNVSQNYEELGAKTASLVHVDSPFAVDW